MCFQIQMQQLDPELLVVGGQRRAHRARMRAAAVERERDGDCGQRNQARIGAHDELIEHGCRRQTAVSPAVRRENRAPCARRARAAARQVETDADARRAPIAKAAGPPAHTRDEIFFRQRREHAQRAHAPRGKSSPPVPAQDPEPCRAARPMPCFLALRNHLHGRARRQTSRHAHGRMQIAAHRRRRRDADGAHALNQFPRQRLRRPKQTSRPGNIDSANKGRVLRCALPHAARTRLRIPAESPALLLLLSASGPARPMPERSPPLRASCRAPFPAAAPLCSASRPARAGIALHHYARPLPELRPQPQQRLRGKLPAYRHAYNSAVIARLPMPRGSASLRRALLFAGACAAAPHFCRAGKSPPLHLHAVRHAGEYRRFVAQRIAGSRRSESSALLFAHPYCASSKMHACVLSAAAR